MKLYWFGYVVQEMQFKDFFLFLALGTNLFSRAEQCNFGTVDICVKSF